MQNKIGGIYYGKNFKESYEKFIFFSYYGTRDQSKIHIQLFYNLSSKLNTTTEEYATNSKPMHVT